MAVPVDAAVVKQGNSPLPEVPLQWSDFMWSLEKLRHRRYGKRMRERDWFRINPLEIVLLSAQSIIADSVAKRDHGTMVLVMCSLRKEMSQRPRYWYRLVSVLFSALQAKDTPSTILQRCCISVLGLLKAVERFSGLYPAILSWAIVELQLIKGLEQLIKERRQTLGIQLSLEVQNFVDYLHNEVKSAVECWESLTLKTVIDEGKQCKGRIDMKFILTGIVKETIFCSPHQLSLQVQIFTILKDDRYIPATILGSNMVPFQELLTAVQDFDNGVGKVLAILQHIFVRSNELEGLYQAREQDRSYSSSQSNYLSANNKECSESGFGENISQDVEGEAERGELSDKRDTMSSSFEFLIPALWNSLLLALKKWEDLSVQGKPSSNYLASVACKLLTLAEVILASKPLDKSIPEIINFFHIPMSTLMVYSTEGYLTDAPNELFFELLEYVSSLIEQGFPPLLVLQTNLPNLFGPAFGIHDHHVSCKLLEYGYLSVCSQHQKSLLSEGLRFIMDVFHLFLPIDEIKSQEKYAFLRTEAVIICSLLLEDLLKELPLENAESLHKDMWLKEDIPVMHSLPPQSMDLLGESVGEDSALEHQSTVTDFDKETDRDTRINILLKLLQLACMMVRNGDNVSFLFASILPKLFKCTQVPPIIFNKKKLEKFFGEESPLPVSSIPWNVDKKKLAIQLLNLTILSLDYDITSPFQLCGIVTPKLVRNIDGMDLRDQDKLFLMMDVLKITENILEEGLNIDDFLSHGIDLLSNLLPITASADEFRQFANQMARHFVTSSQSSLLFLIKHACQFMITNFSDEEEGVRGLFKTLVFRGKRDEIRGVFRVCKSQLHEDKYSVIRQFIYSYANGQLSHKQLVALCELLVVVMDMETPRRMVREVVINVEEEDEQLVKEKMERKRKVISELTSPCLRDIEDALKERRFKKEVWEKISKQLSHITLFRTLYQDEFALYSDLTSKQLLDLFGTKFPPEVLCSEDMMGTLAVCATRIEHMQVPRYSSLKSLLSSHLRYFLTLTPHLSPVEPSTARVQYTIRDEPKQSPLDALQNTLSDSGDSLLEKRVQEFESYLQSVQRNVEDRQQLVKCGYSNKLWNEKLTLTVKTDGSHSLEENMRQTLLACYREFCEILKQMAITHVSVDGEIVKSSELFSEELSLVELKGRRAIAVRVIDQRLGQTRDGHFYERKVNLLSKEDQIESDFEKQAKVPVKPKTFTVALNTSFYDCARCCGPQIIGCYAPIGEHSERPLEIGIRCDSAMASIYDESGLEIENVEILFTEEGAYLFKAYSNGHPYDTSQVWASLFVAMLKEDPSALVPTIIVPSGYPNTRTWEILRRAVFTEITGSVLTCRHDFLSEWRTYYDHRPERVRLGTDIVLHTDFNLTSDQSRPSFQRQRSCLTKDLPGAIFEDIIKKFLEDEWLKQFIFLGKVISEYISVSVRERERRTKIIESRFDYERWSKVFNKMKEPLNIPASLKGKSEQMNEGFSQSLPSKETIVESLTSYIDREVLSWCEQVDMKDLCVHNHKQLLEFKEYLENGSCFVGNEHMKDKLQCVRRLLHQCTFIIPILELPDSLQEEIIHWIFGNEDRVWRYRGGRDGHETLQQFMNFLGRQPLPANIEVEDGMQAKRVTIQNRSSKVYPGVVVFCLPELVECDQQRINIDSSNIQVRQMVGYAVGEMMKPLGEDFETEGENSGEMTRWYPKKTNQCYEVVTAWVHPNYRGLNMGVRMYFDIIMQASAQLVMCDMLVGSIERIIQSNFLLRMLRQFGIIRMLIRKRQVSYTVVSQTGKSEQFEQVLFNTRPLRLILRVDRAASWCKANPKLVLSATLASVAIIAVPVAVLTATKFM